MKEVLKQNQLATIRGQPRLRRKAQVRSRTNRSRQTLGTADSQEAQDDAADRALDAEIEEEDD